MFAILLLASAALQVRFDASEFTNAVYHLACLGGQINCTNKQYTEFWNDRYKVTPEDGARIDAWREVFKRAEAKASSPEPMPLLPNYARHYPFIRVRQDLMSAALESHSAVDLERRARKLVPVEDAALLRKAVESFQTRLRPWWVEYGRAVVERHRKDVEAYIRKHGLGSLADDAGRFLDARLDSGAVYLHLVPGPNPKLTDASAALVRDHFTVEVLPPDDGSATAWKALHELTHGIYEAMPTQAHRRNMEVLIELAGREGQALYAYLNEVLATGFQLLMFERLGLADDDPYRHRYIPRLARAAKRVIARALAAKRRLDAAFLQGYVEAARAELKAEISSPRFLLASAGLMGPDELVAPARELIQPISWLAGEDSYKRFSDLNGVWLMTYDMIPPGQFQELKKRDGFVFVNTRGKGGMELVMGGRDRAAVGKTVERLLAAPSLPVSGSALPD